MSKKKGFYLQKMHSYINALDRIDTSVYSVKVVPTLNINSITNQVYYHHN